MSQTLPLVPLARAPRSKVPNSLRQDTQEEQHPPLGPAGVHRPCCWPNYDRSAGLGLPAAGVRGLFFMSGFKAFMFCSILKTTWGTSPVVQWLRLCVPKAAGMGSIPGQGTRSHRPQLRICQLWLKIPHAAWRSKTLHTTARTQRSHLWMNKLKRTPWLIPSNNIMCVCVCVCN